MAEVINPPSYFFSTIDFNPTFYTSTNGSLSQTQANALYLQKTIRDTATALETFSAGIQTPSLSSTGTGASNILNIGIQSRTASGAVHHYSDGDNCVSGADVEINNGLTNNSATNIHNGTGANATGQVNIMSGSENSGSITIGNETTNDTTTTFRGNTTITRLATALTPTYSYPVAAGKVGERIVGTNTTAYPSPYVDKQASTVSLTKGVWILTSVITTVTLVGANAYFNNYISTVPNVKTNLIGALEIGVISTSTNTGSTTASAIVSINATTSYYVNIQAGQTNPVSTLVFSAIRIS
jgi:hypothetical protein